MFPKKYLISHGVPQSQYNQIANFVFLQQEINIKIKDAAPCIYMADVLHQCETKQPVYGGITERVELQENLRQSCIPDGFEKMDITNYQEFLVSRRKLMAQLIREYYWAL